jgi:hypothetical protein
MTYSMPVNRNSGLMTRASHKKQDFLVFSNQKVTCKRALISLKISSSQITTFSWKPKLLKIKDFEKDKYQQLATDYDKQVSAYIGTISKLQKENEKLRAQGQNIRKSTAKQHPPLYRFTCYRRIRIFTL